MAVAGLKTCHFVTYTSKGIFIVTITFNDKFWATVVAAVYKFYCQQIVPSFLMEALPSEHFYTKQLSQRQEDQQIQEIKVLVSTVCSLLYASWTQIS